MWDVVSRTAAAVIGGYAVAYAVCAALALGLPIPRTDAVLAASLLSFAVHVSAVIWCFAAPRARLAWIGTVAPAAMFGAISFGPRAIGL